MFASPIGYPSTLIPAYLRPLYGLNPLAGLIEGFRWAAANSTTRPWSEVAVSFGVTVVLLVVGSDLFRAKRELVRGHHLMATIVTVENLGKRYRLGENTAGYGRLTESLSNVARRRRGAQVGESPRTLGAARTLRSRSSEGRWSV